VPPAGSRYFRLVLRKELTPLRAGWAIAAATLFVTVVCGIVIRVVDPTNFGNVWVGMWWAVQTVTTVGYGDIVPTDVAGRVIAALLMLAGIGVLSVVTAVVTAAFIETARRRMGDDPGQRAVMARLDELAARLDSIESAVRR
jgi:voltage-gated potassium channel